MSKKLHKKAGRPKLKDSEKLRQLQVKVSPDTHKKIDEYQQKTGLKKNELIRIALAEYFK